MEGRDLPAWRSGCARSGLGGCGAEKGMAARLRDSADAHTRHSLPPAESIQRYVRSYESGQHAPGDLYAELYCRAFGLTREALFGSSRHSGVSPSPSEHDATSLSAWIVTSNTSDEAVTHIDEDRAALAEAHTRLPPGPVLADVYALHRQVQALLRSGRQHLRQTRELFRSTRISWPMPACCWMTLTMMPPPGHTERPRSSAQQKPSRALLSRSAPRPRPPGGRVSSLVNGPGRSTSCDRPIWPGEGSSAVPSHLRCACCSLTRRPAPGLCSVMRAARRKHCATPRMPRRTRRRTLGDLRGHAPARAKHCMRCQ